MMTNIFKIKQCLEQLKTDPELTTEQQHFITSLIDKNPGEMGWRTIEQIAKRPYPENRIGRLAAAIELESKKTPLWRISKKSQLKLMKQEIDGENTAENKLKHIQEIIISTKKISEFSLIMGECSSNSYSNKMQRLFGDIPLHDEIDHLINAIDNELKKYLNDEKYIAILKSLRSELVDFHQAQVTKWVCIQSNPTSTQNTDLIYKQAASYGTIMFVARQIFDLHGDGSDCFGHTIKWSSDMLKNHHSFLGLHASGTPAIKPMSYQSNFAKRFPEYNHLIPLTEQISTDQYNQKEDTLFNEITTYVYSLPVFFISTECLAKELIKASRARPNSIILLSLESYNDAHCLAFGKIEAFYHFFDTNLGWMRFDNVENFEKWFSIYFKTKFLTGGTSYYDTYHEAYFKLIDRISDESTRKNQIDAYLQNLARSPLMMLIACYYILQARVPAITNVYTIFIRSIIYSAFLARTLLEHLLQMPHPNNKIEMTQTKYSSDDIDVPRKPPLEMIFNDDDQDNTDTLSQNDIDLLAPDDIKTFQDKIASCKREKRNVFPFFLKKEVTPYHPEQGESTLHRRKL